MDWLSICLIAATLILWVGSVGLARRVYRLEKDLQALKKETAAGRAIALVRWQALSGKVAKLERVKE